MFGNLQFVTYSRKVKIMTFWDKFASLYDLGQALNYKVLKGFEKATEKLVPEGALVLDTAAGTGRLTFAAAKKAERVICTDLSMPMLREARKKAAKYKVSNVEFEVRDIFNLKDNDETYDVVMAGNVLHLLDEPEKALAELWRVTKKGGKLLLPTYVLGEKFSSLLKLYKAIGFNPSTNYTPETYGKMLYECGLGKVKIKTIEGWLPCCYAVIEKPLT